MPAKERDGLPVYQNPQCYLQEIDATTAGPKTAELLAIPRRDPLLRIRQVIYSTKGNTHVCIGLLSRRPAQPRHSPVPVDSNSFFSRVPYSGNSMAGDPGKQ